MKFRLCSTTGNTVGVDNYLGFSEIDDFGYWSRYIEINSNGSAYRYSRDHVADEYGILPEGLWDENEASKVEYGTVSVISAELFENVWARTKCDNFA